MQQPSRESTIPMLPSMMRSRGNAGATAATAGGRACIAAVGNAIEIRVHIKGTMYIPTYENTAPIPKE